ncbi:ies1p [Saccharomyces arboricola H-6]|uniref:Ies1p n=1 Tax=Saccharomyces arboricola (strain H-6 / AS 2.3317 / CBS 10644) TaxID=1160507 RepID=J8LP73_SACAR|nr:ies1p [Saccharomyces arboricola H-6]
MGNRVYDPIHDTFQLREDSPEETKMASTACSSQAGVTEGGPTDSNPSGIEAVTIHEIEIDDKNDDDSTQSEEENTNILLNFEPSVVPEATGAGVATGSTTTNTNTLRKKPKESSSSKYNRHLKKPDGEPFNRKDIQFNFMQELLMDKRQIFTNALKPLYKNSVVPINIDGDKISINVTDTEYDARTFVFNDKLTFAQLYVLTIATSIKCSKILRDKLLLDQQVAFSTCVLALLVNIGRLNTTINFYLEMTSQLRTFHSVPVLQLHANDPKLLQDTPRLKSILKNLPWGNEQISLMEIYEKIDQDDDEVTIMNKFNIINMLFSICDNFSLIDERFISKYVEIISEDDPALKPEEKKDATEEVEAEGDGEEAEKAEKVGTATLLDILDFSKYEPKDRSDILIWLLYIHLETNLSQEEVQESVDFFKELDNDVSSEGKFTLRRTQNEYDIDPEDEVEFGASQRIKRREFMSKMEEGKKRERINASEAKNAHTNADANADVSEVDGEEGDEKCEEIAEETRSLLTPTPILESSSPMVLTRKKVTPELPKTTAATAVPVVADTEEEIAAAVIIDKNDLNLTPLKKYNSSATVNKVEKLISLDLNKHVAENGKTQEEFLADLRKFQAPNRLKRRDIGLIKIFNEFEDIPVASVLGIRGKKRKKFKDNLLGFETDYMKNLGVSKKVLLKRIEHADIDDEASSTMFKLD